MHYTLHQLKVFVQIVDCQSITRASEKLFLSQPAVSIQLKKLQEQFELPLTEVIGRQLYVTDFGKDIAERSKRILDEADQIKYTIDRYKGLLSGKIKISVVSTGKYVIPYFLKPFMDLHPGIDISIDVSNKSQVVDSLSKNECDFALVSVVPDFLKVKHVELMDNKLYLVGNKKHPDSIKNKKDLENVTLLFREEGSATKNAMQDFLDSNSVKVDKAMRLVSNEAIKQAINAGIGFSIIPIIGSRSALQNENLQVFPMKGLPIITKWNLIFNKGKNLTPAQEALVAFMEANKDSISEKHFQWNV